MLFRSHPDAKRKRGLSQRSHPAKGASEEGQWYVTCFLTKHLTLLEYTVVEEGSSSEDEDFPPSNEEQLRLGTLQYCVLEPPCCKLLAMFRLEPRPDQPEHRQIDS